MTTAQITVRPSDRTVLRTLLTIATAALVTAAPIAASAAAEPDTIWPDHLVTRDAQVAADEDVWPDHLVTREVDLAVEPFLRPDHLWSPDDRVASAR